MEYRIQGQVITSQVQGHQELLDYQCLKRQKWIEIQQNTRQKFQKVLQKVPSSLMVLDIPSGKTSIVHEQTQLTNYHIN